MEQSVWHKLGTTSGSVPEMGILSGDAMPSGFHLPSFGSTLKVGALVEPLTTQMAAYLGVESGLMVKQVAHKSEAEKSGLRAFDVILKVGPDFIATSADWDRSLRCQPGQAGAGDHPARQKAADAHAASGFEAPEGRIGAKEDVCPR